MDLKSKKELHHIDPYVYACIRRYMNKDTMIAFPSITTLIIDSGISKNPLIESISRLANAGYFTIIKKYGKSNQYLFNKYKQFEIFSYDFLDDKTLTNKEKAYLVAAQQFMFKHPETKTGDIQFDSKTFAESIGLSTTTLTRIEKGLKEKQVLTMIPTNQKELMTIDGQTIPITGFNLYNRIYNFEQFSNLLALKFQQQDKRLDDHEEEIKELKDEYKTMKVIIEQLCEENKQLKEQLQSKIIL